MSRQETNSHGNRENCNEMYVTDALYMYMTTINTKLTNDTGKMVSFNEWYKLGRELNAAVFRIRIIK